MNHRGIPVSLLLLASLSGCVPAARMLGLAPHPEPLAVDPDVIRGRLPNGLTYYVRASREPEHRAELRLAVNAGSVLEDDDQRGMAHLVEHMAFNGTRHFPKQALVDYLESIGMRFGPDVNAYTSYDETVYMLTLPTDSAGALETGVEMIGDWADGVAFDSVEVEKERGVVLEEWRLGQGAGSRMQQRQFPVLARFSRYADRDPIGTPESIRKTRLAALKRFYRDWYRPDLMAVVAVGDFDAKKMEALIRQRFGGIPAPAHPRKRKEYGVPEHSQTVVSVATDPEATGSNVSLYLKRRPVLWKTVHDYRDWLVQSMASGMFTDRLGEITDRPDSPFLDVSSFQGRFLRPLSAYVVSVRVPDAGVENGLEELLKEAQRVEEYGFTASELDRAKRELLRREEQRYAERDKITSASYAAEYVSQYLYGGAIVDAEEEHELYRRLIPTIRLAEVNAASNGWVHDQNRVILVSAPRNDSIPAPSEVRLRLIVAISRFQRVEPYTDSVSSAPLLAHAPTPGRLLSSRVLPDVGVTEWKLSNGVRVLLKPTDYQRDEVLVAGRSPGGTSLLPDSDYVAGLTAAAVAQAGGLGALSATELRKRLAGTVAGVGADIQQDYEGISGASSVSDLETFFQLVYLKFTAPRLDSAAVEAYRTQARSSISDRAASPEFVFADSLRSTLTQHNPRTRLLTAAMLDSMDFHRSLEIYRDRFSDAGDFTFYITGSFDLDSIRPLVLRYIGGLPSDGRVESSRDTGNGPPRGILHRTVHRGMEPKALTQIVFTGPLDFGRERLLELGALSDVLRLRLRESLREDRSGTYGVQVSAGGTGDGIPRYQVSIGFGSDPQRVEELTRVVFAEIDRLKRVGPTADEVRKVREMELRGREIEMRSNHFWTTQMMVYDHYGWDLRDLLTFPQFVERIDTEKIGSAAERYLDLENYLQASLLPEGKTARR
jgi:zinc protease